MNADLNFQNGYYSGISGLQLHIPKYLFPPPYENASRLTYYSTIFNSIEINSSFYKIPQPATIARWSDSMNDHFKFTFKLWKGITHSPDFNFKKEDVLIFMNSIKHVKDKKGCLLIQFPPSLGKEFTGRLNKLLGYIREPAHDEWKIAIEFRNKSWYNESTYSLLKKFKATLVIHDIPKSATPAINQEPDFFYFRFHGPTGNYRDSYSEDFLHEYACYINELLTAGKTVFVYFNNTMGNALNNLKTLNVFLNYKI